MRKIYAFAVAGLTAAATLGAVSANAAINSSAERAYGFYQSAVPNAAHANMNMYDHSGSRGRLGLGANPARPEGPANFSD